MRRPHQLGNPSTNSGEFCAACWKQPLGAVASMLLTVAATFGQEAATPAPIPAPPPPPPAPVSRPFFSWQEGVWSDSLWLRSGKLDFLFRGLRNEEQYNAFAWTPVFKGGAGYLDPQDRTSTTYWGGYLRPLAGWPEKGDLLLAAQGVDGVNRRDVEGQAEYRLPFGLGAGGGIVKATQTGNDISFGKLTWRNQWRGWSYILEGQGQSVEGEVSPGGYVALYNPIVMGVAGSDGEQWRVTGGYVAPTNRTSLRPAAEALYVDNSIGEFEGPQSLFVNGTLRLQGGFLTHPARLGRAMGPQGLEFGNPLGFLFPTWNRRLETWEMGGLLDVRYERLWFPNRTTQERVDGLLYPFQFTGTRGLLDYLFAGASYTRTTAVETPGVLAGFFGRFAFLNLTVGVEHQFDPNRTIVVVGVIDTF